MLTTRLCRRISRISNVCSFCDDNDDGLHGDNENHLDITTNDTGMFRSDAV
jgi:hypothetical protein